jgi:ATP-dependent DNA ligase
MLARLEEVLPVGSDWVFEPKWDGFRALIHRRGSEAHIQSRNSRSLTPFFSDVATAATRALPDGCVIDGELVCPVRGGVDFGRLQHRLVSKCGAEAVPAALIAFDVLEVERADITGWPLSERKRILEGLVKPSDHIGVTPQTRDVADAEGWLRHAGVEGVVAKHASGRYRPGERGWIKVKRRQTLDVVVGGLRGNHLLLGLYDRRGRLHHIGETVRLRPSEMSGIADSLALVAVGATFTGRPPGLGRWPNERFNDWVEVEPRVVVEVSYTLLDAGARRFRHAVRIARLRPDRDPYSCNQDQFPDEAWR